MADLLFNLDITSEYEEEVSLNNTWSFIHHSHFGTEP